MNADDYEIAVRVLAALAAGALIGYERSYHGRPAGFRTHALVCTASSLLMLVTLYQRFLEEGIAFAFPAQVGYTAAPDGTLIMPYPPAGDDASKNKPGGTNRSGGPPRHPLIEGMFQSLPANGQPWTLDEAADWLHAAAYNLRFAYKLKGKITVDIKIEKPNESN